MFICQKKEKEKQAEFILSFVIGQQKTRERESEAKSEKKKTWKNKRTEQLPFFLILT